MTPCLEDGRQIPLVLLRKGVRLGLPRGFLHVPVTHSGPECPLSAVRSWRIDFIVI
jgi:hypothetical protein